MLAQKNRFAGHGSLRYVYANGNAVRTQKIVVKFTRNPHRTDSRFAVVVSKKVLKSAVGRNRIRRRVYEIIRKEMPRFDGVLMLRLWFFIIRSKKCQPKSFDLCLSKYLRKLIFIVINDFLRYNLRYELI